MMELSLELILERLTIQLPRVYTTDNVEHKFKGTALFSPSMPPQDQHVLYIGFLSDILALSPEAVEGMTICCLGHSEDLNKVRSDYACNLLHFEPPVDLASCYNTIHSLFCGLREMETQLDLILLKKGTIQEMADVFEPWFDNPFFIWDNSYQVLGKTRYIETVHPILKEISETNRLPSEFLAHVTRGKDSIMHKTELYTTMRIHYPPNITNTRFALRVFMSGQKTALVACCYFVNSSPTMGRIELFQLLLAKLDQYVQEHYPVSHFKSAIYESFIVDLVEGRLRLEQDIMERLYLINLPYETEYRIYYITAQQYSPSILHYLLLRCKNSLPHAKIIPYQTGILILDQEARENRDPDTVQTKLTNAEIGFSNLGASCGISSVCTNLSQVREAFIQAKAALRLGQMLNSENVIYYYRDYCIYHILDICANNPEISLAQLCCKRLDCLEQLDIERKHDNMRLLEIYLRNNLNITDTAKEMYLHRNSVIYRLERIEEILRVPLRNPDVQFRLLMSFHIRRLISARKGKDRGY